MFGIDKKKLIQGLQSLQKHQCAYHGPVCDCKYGVQDPQEHHVNPKNQLLLTEQNGCPELRLVAKILLAMSDEDFYDLCRKANVVHIGEAASGHKLKLNQKEKQ